MTDSSLFISSCSRRQLARRRAWRRAGLALPPWATGGLLVLVSGLAAFVVGRGGI